MKLGIMQPYFFPYLGYISLIKHTNQFILFDSVQFIKHGWIERNRILKQGGGWTYIAIPLEKHPRETLIKDIRIRKEPWQEKLIAQLTFYKRRAPYYAQTIDVVKEAIALDTDSITLLNYNVLKTICKYLSIPFNCQIFSKMNLQIETPHAPDEWALNICKVINGTTEYWNPPGGISFFDRKKYECSQIKLVFQQVELLPYSQYGLSPSFEAGLSIVDVMMFNSPQTICSMLDRFKLITENTL
ncbi:WbqC family protein [Candidatus Avelusimicrobium alvi]|uniref:WbqC family protein n=1 Tax=Candidatus Avelusimicrobium alvi TaxID=3416221 RepID=UPI003D0D5598